MEDNVVKKIITNAKNMFSGRKKSDVSTEYAFSPEEIAEINKTNKQKITKLQEDLFKTDGYPKNQITSKKENLTYTETAIDNLTKNNNDDKNEEDEGNAHNDNDTEIDSITQDKENIIRNDMEEKIAEINKNVVVDDKKDINTITNNDEQSINTTNVSKSEVKNEQKIQNSYVNLSAQHQKIVMDKWQAIDINVLDKDILFGKDLLNHNYAITYADDAARFVHKIRKDYEIVICYLIGFNNEKKGIYDKTIFSNHVDNEWKYLNNYLKILEKIRSFKK